MSDRPAIGDAETLARASALRARLGAFLPTLAAANRDMEASFAADPAAARARHGVDSNLAGAGVGAPILSPGSGGGTSPMISPSTGGGGTNSMIGPGSGTSSMLSPSPGGGGPSSSGFASGDAECSLMDEVRAVGNPDGPMIEMTIAVVPDDDSERGSEDGDDDGDDDEEEGGEDSTSGIRIPGATAPASGVGRAGISVVESDGTVRPASPPPPPRGNNHNGAGDDGDNDDDDDEE
jgi:hypothetical protein